MAKTSKVILKPTSVIKAQLGIQPDGPVLAFFTNTCYKAMDRFVPMSNNRSETSLRKDVHVEPGSITYEMPYAEYQYYGRRKDGSHVVMNYTTPGTGIPGQGSYWDQRMWSVEKDKIVKAVQDKIDRGV